jgi:hypothetical protein
MVDGSCNVSWFQRELQCVPASVIAVVRILLLLDFAEVDFVTVWCFCFAMMLLQHTDFGQLPQWAVDAGYLRLLPVGLTGLVLQ